ncbi:MAG: hypothetical protein JO053_16215 [Acidobacteria bacterium]|nr:hypothetical protein [Acidobacteriota bacterium]
MSMRKVAVLISVAALMLVAAFAIATGRSSARHFVAMPAPTPEVGERKGFTGYRGITIGLTADAVRTKLGVPKDKGDEQDLYVFSDTETAQFFYDASHTVSAIMITYTGMPKEALKPVDLFGVDAEAKADGGIFKMERYPKAGYWISYNKTPGTDSVVSIAVQKIPH